MATVRLSAHDPFRFERLTGRVALVGADAIDDVSGHSYYRVIIHIDPLKGPDHGGIALRPGMMGSASIVIGRKSVLSVILAPFLRDTVETQDMPL